MRIDAGRASRAYPEKAGETTSSGDKTGSNLVAMGDVDGDGHRAVAACQMDGRLAVQPLPYEKSADGRTAICGRILETQ